MLQFQDLIRDIHPGIFIHSVYIEQDLSADQKATYVCLSLLLSHSPDAQSRIVGYRSTET